MVNKQVFVKTWYRCGAPGHLAGNCFVSATAPPLFPQGGLLASALIVSNRNTGQMNVNLSILQRDLNSWEADFGASPKPVKQWGQCLCIHHRFSPYNPWNIPVVQATKKMKDWTSVLTPEMGPQAISTGIFEPLPVGLLLGCCSLTLK